MTQEDKDLLLKDLCARLSYKTIILFNNKHKFTLNQMNPYQYAGKDGYGVIFDFGGKVYSVEDCKPYLRPMSSMTEEERHDYNTIAMHTVVTSKGFVHFEATDLIDWLNAHHFDFRNLIERGLAIEVTEENNPYNE